MLAFVRTQLKVIDPRSKGWVKRARGVLLGPVLSIRRRFHSRLARFAPLLEIGVWLLIGLTAFYQAPHLQEIIEPHIGADEFEALQSLILTVGGALIGATAIVTSFVLFALQVNVDRLPYGLFYRFSSEPRMLGSFAAAFATAIAASSLVLVTEKRFSALVILAALAAVALVLRLLFLAYKRSLRLIDPVSQLRILTRASAKEMRRWDRYFRWLVPLIRSEKNGGEIRSDLDISRTMVMAANKGWDAGLQKSIQHAVAFSRQAAERGDLAVSSAALKSVIKMNASYVSAKGKTFQSDAILIENPFATDATINHTLEELRLLSRAALGRNDEAYLEQIFLALIELTNLYLTIPYPTIKPSPIHANLAVRYLEEGIKAGLAAGWIDTTMQGLRYLSRAASEQGNLGYVVDSASTARSISVIGLSALQQPTGFPVAVVMMEELSKLQLQLLLSTNVDAEYAAREVRDTIFAAVGPIMQLSSGGFVSQQSQAISPYFSSANSQSFLVAITGLSAALPQEKNDQRRVDVLRNLAGWGEQLYRPVRSLLDETVKQQSFVIHDLLGWIFGLSELFVSLASDEQTPEYLKKRLLKSANWLFASLTFVPRKPETARWLETFSFTEQVFEMTLFAKEHEWSDGFSTGQNLLINWAFEAGVEQTGWDIMPRALTAACALGSLANDESMLPFLEKVREKLKVADAQTHDVLVATASTLDNKAEDLPAMTYAKDPIDRLLMRDVDEMEKQLKLLSETLRAAVED